LLAADTYVRGCNEAVTGTGGDSGTINNQISLAWLIKFGMFNYYTGGDIGIAQEKEIAKYLNAQSPPIKLDAFKLSHHGSKHSTPDELLGTLKANGVGIVPVGRNTYGHVNDETLSRALDESTSASDRAPNEQITEKLSRIYFSGQLDQFFPKIEGGKEKPSVDTFKDVSDTTYTGYGNIVIRVDDVNKGQFSVSYDYFGFGTEKASGSDNTVLGDLKDKLPPNAFFEIVMNFILVTLKAGNSNYKLYKDNAISISAKIVTEIKEKTALLDVSDVSSSVLEVIFKKEQNLTNLTVATTENNYTALAGRCQKIRDQINNSTTSEGKTRKTFADGGLPPAKHINKRVDAFENRNRKPKRKEPDPDTGVSRQTDSHMSDEPGDNVSTFNWVVAAVVAAVVATVVDLYKRMKH
jgi:hypothetical protein